MQQPLYEHFHARFGDADPDDPVNVTAVVDAILTSSQQTGASDVHLLPTQEGLRMSWRIDGVLQPVTTFSRTVAASIVSRLKVLAELLTYHNDVPQEGRIRDPLDRADAVEMRVSTFPTVYGEKAVVRLFGGSGRYRYLNDLGLPQDVTAELQRQISGSGGILLVSGPAGSGKTTTVYALLRELVDKFGVHKSLVSLEDPIEAVVDGVAQSQVKPSAEFTYAKGLRSLMRQDPEVIMVGEIRDRETAQTVFQAGLTGHLVLTTFHAGSAAEAVNRLSDMDVEPYLLRSGIRAILCQRLVRRLCRCASVTKRAAAKLGLDVPQVCQPEACQQCRGTGYDGRTVLAEMLSPDLRETGRAILSRSDAKEIERLAVEAGMVTNWQRARQAVEAGTTSPAEVRRVFGVDHGSL